MRTKRNNKPAFLVAVFVGLATIACGDADTTPDTSMDTPTTRMRQMENVQAVFEIMPKQSHDHMLELMGGRASLKGGAGAIDGSHFVMLTLMDVAARGQTITDADVRFSVLGPGGQSLVDQGGHELSGKGMHHYAVGFAGDAPGTYVVSASIERGGKSYSQTVRFDIDIQ